MVANSLFNVKTLGLDMVLPRPRVSNAVISNFNILVPNFLIIPIPLVAPATGKLVKLSVLPPRIAASPSTAVVPDPVEVPIIPPLTLPATFL